MAVKSVSGMLKVCVIIEKCFFFSCRNVVSSYADIQVIIIIFPLLHISTHTHSTVEWLVCSRVSPHVGNICKYIWCNGRWFFAVYFCHITHINFVSVFLSSSVRLSVCLSVCLSVYLSFSLRVGLSWAINSEPLQPLAWMTRAPGLTQSSLWLWLRPRWDIPLLLPAQVESVLVLDLVCTMLLYEHFWSTRSQHLNVSIPMWWPQCSIPCATKIKPGCLF